MFASAISKYVCIALGASLVLSNASWYVLYDLQGNKLTAAVQGRKDDRARYVAAQKEAEAMSLRAALEKERHNAKIKQEADEAYAAVLSKYNASIVRYKAAQRTTYTVNLPGSPDTSSGSDTASEGTGLLISLEDAGICAENTARLQIVKNYYDSISK